MGWVCEGCKEIKLEDDDFYCPKCKPVHQKVSVNPVKKTNIKKNITDVIANIAAACGFVVVLYVLLMMLIYYTLFRPKDKHFL